MSWDLIRSVMKSSAPDLSGSHRQYKSPRNFLSADPVDTMRQIRTAEFFVAMSSDHSLPQNRQLSSESALGASHTNPEASVLCQTIREAF